jgi:hypothetical protein
MRILAVSRNSPGVTMEQILPRLKPEAARVWELYQAGVIREIYFREDGRGAVILLESGNAEEARKHLDSLPLVQEKMISFDVVGLTPYPGYAKLFAEPK